MRHIALLLCALFVCIFAQTDKKIVQVNLVANWQEAPLQYEISEFLKENEPKLLWNLLKDVQSDKSEDFLAYCKQHLTNEQYSLMEYALTIHYFAPKIQIQRQLHHEALASLSESLQSKAKSCSSWVHINDQVACTPDELNSHLSSSSSSTPLAQDTVFSSTPSAPTAFLYASLGSSSSLHTALADLSAQGKLTYVLRYNIPDTLQKLPLAGYGVDLAIKSLEYKSVDDTKVEASDNHGNAGIEDEEEETQGFLFGVLKKRKPELSNELSAFKSFLTGSNIQFESLKVWNLKDLGYQAAQRIVKAANPLKLMADLSQNFPNHAVALSRVKVNDTFKSELQNSRLLPEGESLALINGRVIHLETINPFQLYSILQEESFKLNSLLTLKISKTDAFKILSTAADKSPANTFKIPIDAPITFINDLESDAQYHGWPRSVSELFRRVWPGSFRYIAKNLFTSVTFINAGDPRSYEIVSVLESVLAQSVPFRFGFVMSTLSYEEIASIVRSDPSALDLVPDSISTTIAKVFLHVRDEYGPRHAVNFLRMMSSVSDISEETIQFALDNTLTRVTSSKVKVSSIAKATTFDSQISAANKLVYQMGIDTTPSSFLNGQYIPADDSQAILQETISVSFDQVGKLQELVRTGQLRDHSNVFEVLMKQPNLLSHFSSLILPSNSNPLKFINMIQNPSPTKYYVMSPEDSDSTKAITHLLVVDVTRSSHIELMGDAMNFLKSNPKETRLGFIFSDAGDQLLPKSIFAAMDTQLQKKAFNFIDALITFYNKEKSVSRDQILKIASEQNLNEKFTKAFEDADYSQELSQHSQYAQNTQIRVPSIITNGRIITVDSVFTVEDWKFLGEFERKSRVNSVLDIVSMATIEGVDSESQTSDFFSDIVMSSVSIIGLDQQNNIEKYSLPSHAKISLVISQDKPETFLITCIINPLSIAAQRFTPILETLSSFFDVKIQLIFNPKEESNLPLKNFYQYVLPTSLSSVPTAKFTNLPTHRLLTLALDTPESWLVTPTIARYDLDNIKLDDIDDKLVFAQFELTSIIMEGNCYEYGNPPRGLELELRSNLTRRDTIVMSNYGYFQLKANPGIWELQLKENSRSKMIYKFVGGESKVFVDSFEGIVKHVNVQKYPERMHEQLLSDDPSPTNNNYWGSISNLWPGGKPVAGNESDTIHVFSLASGHLYERFLKIMMLTVTRNTKSNVKFWLLANFLSPKFKDFIPHMAKQYNFEYELVTYKWPSWLHKQTEKQRIIWGYKILFLDVLFPLDLKKVIYVDADQIVKSDLKELWDMDLQGAPYAYTPFCKDKPEMDGFKFWNQGFWANHLRGLPYHISALYVVDLVQFRKMAAGDILRSNYDQLSQDPNSLANLDQDLPNYLQHQVRIFSLPSEWLWCETWCSDGSKEAAKTIDLCNNPLTKIPKLDNAVKVIPEWTNMDNEIKSLENQVLSKAVDNVDQAILAMEQAQISL